MSALAKIKHVSSFVRTAKAANNPRLVLFCYCKIIQVNAVVRGEGPERQGTGSADSGRGEISGGNGEILIVVMTGSGEILFFQRRNLWRNFAVKFSCLFCAHLSPQKICHRPSTANFTASLAEIFWSVTAQFVTGSGKAESRKFTARLSHRKV